MSQLSTPVIAIDGHAGAGKSTVAQKLAEKLGFWHVNTGQFYRAITWLTLKQNLEDLAEIEALARKTPIKIGLDLKGEQRVWLDNQDITDELRTEAINQHISLISSFAGVREAVNQQLRQISHPRGIIMDGRDIGTVVMPDAHLKIFLTASVDERAQRRLLEAQAQGLDLVLDELKSTIAERDRKDSQREVAPLMRAKDAVLIDSTALSQEEVLNEIMRLWAQVSLSKVC